MFLLDANGSPSDPESHFTVFFGTSLYKVLNLLFIYLLLNLFNCCDIKTRRTLKNVIQV